MCIAAGRGLISDHVGCIASVCGSTSMGWQPCSTEYNRTGLGPTTQALQHSVQSRAANNVLAGQFVDCICTDV